MAAVFAVITPCFFLGNASGHDFSFHVASWMDVAGQWKEGVLYPRWAEWANYGFGEPRFIFYPPGSWVLGAALGLLLPWKAVPGTLVWLALTLAGGTMYRLARQWMPAGDAIRAAVFYAVNPYHLAVVYFRSDYAELLASALFPLLLLYLVRLGRDRALANPGDSAPASELSLRRGIVSLALTFAAIWFTNAPAAVMASYTLALLLGLLVVLRRSATPLLAGGVAVALGLLLAGVYILPAAFEQGWVNIAQALSAGLRPEENFLFRTINDPEHNRFNLLISTVAMAQIATTGFAAIAARRPAGKMSKGARELWWALLALGAASVALMLPFTSPAWKLLPKLRFVQFPWRWLLPFGSVFALFTAAAIRETRARRFWTVLVAAMLLAVGAFLASQAWWDSEDIPVLWRAISQGKGYEGTDEYCPRGTDHYELRAGVPQVGLVQTEEGDTPWTLDTQASAKIELWQAETKTFIVETPQESILALRLVHYPAWQVEVNSQPADVESREQIGQLLIRVSAGRNRVRVWFARTWDRTAGILLSSAAGTLLLGLALAWRSPRGASPAADGRFQN